MYKLEPARQLNVSVTPRDYQSKVVDEIAINYKNGMKRQIASMPCGSGKTETAAELIRRVWASGKILPDGCVPYFICDRIDLIEQAAERFRRLGFDVGIFQGDNTTRSHSNDVVVASIQTISSRCSASRIVPDDMGMAVIDECHVVHKRHKDILQKLNIMVVGLSATPMRPGLGQLYQAMVRGPTVRELIDAGMLLPTKTITAVKADLSSVRITAGDCNDGDQDKIMRGQEIVGDAVTEWKKHGQDRQTIAICVSIAHAEELAEQFRNDGVTAECIHSKLTTETNDSAKARFASCETRILTSINKLAVGFDSPIASCLMILRKTVSEMFHMQVLGRPMRTYPCQEYAIILDYVGNVLKLGKPDDFIVPDLNDSELKARAKAKIVQKDEFVECPMPDCNGMMPRVVLVCPECGEERRRPPEINVIEGELVDIDTIEGAAKKSEFDIAKEKRLFYRQLMGYAIEIGNKPGWAFYKFQAKYGDRPPTGGELSPMPPGEDVRRWIRHQAIKRYYARKKASG